MGGNLKHDTNTSVLGVLVVTGFLVVVHQPLGVWVVVFVVVVVVVAAVVVVVHHSLVLVDRSVVHHGEVCVVVTAIDSAAV